ncbi:MAG: hypothetical protein OEX07_09470 [Gammaproteobacteria bacterium]|nr:hypothetical protein [Gammaproteobacteria bacterium]
MQKLKLQMRKLLEQRAISQQCISYRDLASELGVTQPPVIATITGLLEEMIDEDVALKKPILSSLVVQKANSKIPRSGFFEKINCLNVVDTSDAGFDENVWHGTELEKLETYYKNEFYS